jgi:hypothetical protein
LASPSRRASMGQTGGGRFPCWYRSQPFQAPPTQSGDRASHISESTVFLHVHLVGVQLLLWSDDDVAAEDRRGPGVTLPVGVSDPAGVGVRVETVGPWMMTAVQPLVRTAIAPTNARRARDRRLMVSPPRALCRQTLLCWPLCPRRAVSNQFRLGCCGLAPRQAA